MKIIKIILLSLLTFFSIFSVLGAPEYNATVDEDAAGGYTQLWTDSDDTLENNIIDLFFPTNDYGENDIGKQLRIALVGLFIVMIIWAGVLMLINADKEEEMNKYKSNLIYLVYGGLLVFGVVWLIGDVLQVGYNTATIETVVLGTQGTIIAKLLVFLKVLAYFVAIIMVVYYGFQIIRANDSEEAITKGKNGLLNVIIVIFAMKILDYLYLIAQKRTFHSQANDLLATISKALGWIAGIMLVLAIIYAAFILLTSRGQEDAWTKAKNIIRNVFIIIIIVFMFIMIMDNMVGEFGVSS